MRLDDVRLRNAARAGEPDACIEIAERYFRGGRGLAQNFQLGLAYLQQLVNDNSPPAVLLIADTVPLDVLMAHKCRSSLEAAARLGSTIACLKLGIWMMLKDSERTKGIQWIRQSGRIELDQELHDPSDPRCIASILRATMPNHVADNVSVALSGAHEALRESNLPDACNCIRAAAELAPADERIAEAVSLVVQRAATQRTTLDLPVDMIESSLWIRSEHGEVEAQYGLGCALGGLPYGQLAPTQLVRRERPRYAASLLMRAADAGKSDAWLNLAEMESEPASSTANRSMSRFFLEKAAKAGVLQAQRKLGAALLKEATSVEKAEAGVHWLSQAAESGDEDAAELLRTLILPLPQLSAEYENAVIEEASAVDPELGARLALARALHLTRHETMSFNAKPNIRSWGLYMRGTTKENPKGRLVPAITPRMKSELQRASVFFNGTATAESALIHQRSRTQRKVFKALSIAESHFFAKEIGRSWSHYGYGRHWAVRVEPLLSAAFE